MIVEKGKVRTAATLLLRIDPRLTSPLPSVLKQYATRAYGQRDESGNEVKPVKK